jgi:putative restriction endonuclease
VRAWVGVTDGDWYRFLRSRGLDEANFWQPGGGGTGFKAIQPGEPFFLKSHQGDGNRLVGVGFLSGWARLPLTSAWEIFGERNGCATFAELRSRITAYRRTRLHDDSPNPEIGCVMLRDIAFFHEGSGFEPPPDWKPNIVQGKGYDLAEPSGTHLEEILRQLLLTSPAPDDAGPQMVPGDVFGDPRLTPVRLGQAAFKALVQEAYQRRCAVTGDKIVPVLQAAHIRPVTSEGQNRVDNGLLLRSDVHTLFDRGYLSVHPGTRTLLVSPRLRSEWGNGEEFYQRASGGEPITSPVRAGDRPNEEFLSWHADEVFLAS